MDELNIRQNGSMIFLKVKVVPGSSRTSIAGVLDGMLKIKISAPPEKGKANEALLEFLAEQLSVKKNAIKITSGLTSSIKELTLDGVAAKQITKLNAKKKQ